MCSVLRVQASCRSQPCGTLTTWSTARAAASGEWPHDVRRSACLTRPRHSSRVCGNNKGIIRKYALDICRQCFRCAAGGKTSFAHCCSPPARGAGNTPRTLASSRVRPPRREGRAAAKRVGFRRRLVASTGVVRRRRWRRGCLFVARCSAPPRLQKRVLSTAPHACASPRPLSTGRARVETRDARCLSAVTLSCRRAAERAVFLGCAQEWRIL